MRESFQYLASAIGTISIPKTHLTELRLVPDVDMYQDWRLELAGTLLLARRLSEVWTAPFADHISRILRAWKDTRILVEFPEQHFEGQDPDVVTCMSDLLALDGMESSSRERLTFSIRECKSLFVKIFGGGPMVKLSSQIQSGKSLCYATGRSFQSRELRHSCRLLFLDHVGPLVKYPV